MLRSLFSGISGLRSHQTMLDVTGNNIANVNTTGFKASQIQFQDTLSQMLNAASGAQDGVGGQNPAQVGLGVQVAGITTNFTQGAAQLTGRSTDMMISGDGFFVVRQGTQQYYTRAGSFDFDSSGQMVLPGDGAIVQGWAADATGAIDTSGQVGDIKVGVGTVMPAKATTTTPFSGNLQADAEVGKTKTVSVKAYDALGNAREVELEFVKGATGWAMTATDGTATYPATGSVALTFDAAGKPTFADTTFALGGVTVDLTGVTGMAGVDTVAADKQDGYAAGILESFTLGSDGTITGSFSNGLKQALGKIAMASFTNPSGLSKAGGSLFTTTVNSGDPQIGSAGTGGRGTMSSGSLEMSNVDLSTEFTQLIIAQRGFQANSRVITTSDEVLQELVNLKR
ncbi:flagellar hook protein FlgE [Cellulomonas hominis]|uniref:Flagellar hook protein FlgE n=1 Tax=Cellulomonas hominis TaxID=156981 RepID=A0A7Z8JXS4_9CELL|nr:flagellar hook protein FlgE [Cellulomonas hominis]TKR21930.1 flagellar hook protein FlgE [Cellulomonas hominis]